MKRYSNRFRQGFTLAELLIVVAIIGVLVAISVPIFSGQLEKSRDAVSIANMRSAYSEAINYSIEYNSADVTSLKYTKLKSGYMVSLDNDVTVWINTNGMVSAVRFPLDVKSHEANDWSGLAENLPFTLINEDDSTGDAEDCDDGAYSKTWHIIFRFKFGSTGEVTEAVLYHSTS